MGIRVVAATAGDLSVIHAAYEAGRVVQRAQSTTSWPEFSDARILSEIENQLLFCVVDGDEFAGVFSIAYEDPLLWGELERGVSGLLRAVRISMLGKRVVPRDPRLSVHYHGIELAADGGESWARGGCGE